MPPTAKHVLYVVFPLTPVVPLTFTGVDEGDYTEAVGGSLSEYKEEKAFEQMLTGTEGETNKGPQTV
jgi:hypothetical protein